MTPPEIEVLERFGIAYLCNIEGLSFFIFLHGASSSLVIYGSSTSSITGVFVVIFSASVVIYMFVSPSCESLIF